MNFAFLFSNSNCVFISILFIVLIVIVCTFFKNTKESFNDQKVCIKSSNFGGAVDYSSLGLTHNGGKDWMNHAFDMAGDDEDENPEEWVDAEKSNFISYYHDQSKCIYKGCTDSAATNTFNTTSIAKDTDYKEIVNDESKCNYPQKYCVQELVEVPNGLVLDTSDVKNYTYFGPMGDLAEATIATATSAHDPEKCKYKGCIEPGYENTVESPPDNVVNDQALCGNKVEDSNNCADGQLEYNGKCYQHHTTITAEGKNCSYLSDGSKNKKKCDPDRDGAGRYYENNEGTKIFCALVDNNCSAVDHNHPQARCVEDDGTCGILTVDNDVSPTSYCVEDQATTPETGKQLDTSDANYKTISQLANTEYVHDQTLCSYIDDPSIVSSNGPPTYCVEHKANRPTGKVLDTTDANYRTENQYKLHEDITGEEIPHSEDKCRYIDDPSIVSPTPQWTKGNDCVEWADAPRYTGDNTTSYYKPVCNANKKVLTKDECQTAANSKGLQLGGYSTTDLENLMNNAPNKCHRPYGCFTDEGLLPYYFYNEDPKCNTTKLIADLGDAVDLDDLNKALSHADTYLTNFNTDTTDDDYIAVNAAKSTAEQRKNTISQNNQLNNHIYLLENTSDLNDLTTVIGNALFVVRNWKGTVSVAPLETAINDAETRKTILEQEETLKESIANAQPNNNTTLTQNIIDGSNLGVKTSILTDAADTAIENLVKKYSVGMMGAMIEETSVGSDGRPTEPVNNCLNECNMLDNLGVWDHVSDKHNIPQSKTGFGTLNYCDYKCQNMKKYCCEGTLGCKGGDNSNIYLSDKKMCYKKTGSTNIINGCKAINNNNCEFEYPFDVNKNELTSLRLGIVKNPNTVGAYAYDNYPIDDDFEEYEEEPIKVKEYCKPDERRGKNKCINDSEIVTKMEYQQ